MEEEKVMDFAIAETFDSIQGEGFWVGTRMFFIRMAGCSVGKPRFEGEIFQECQTIIGQKFTCDTDFEFKARVRLETLLQLVPDKVRHVCITGGEPMTRASLGDLVLELNKRGIMVHIETSGTVVRQFVVDDTLNQRNIWITVSPKIDCDTMMLARANEIKLLIDKHFDLSKLPKLILTHPNVYVQPINGVESLDEVNLELAKDLVMTRMPDWKLSMQAHKVWGM